MSLSERIHSFEHTFTVFTATYNRAHALHRVYDSLRDQSLHDFEWLVVDDGSTDHTQRRVDEWKRGANLPIRYMWQENRGKHIAFNRAVRLARGRFFLPLDSDDALVPNALERFKHYWDSIPGSERDRFSGVCCLCQDEHGNLIGDRFPRDVFDSDSLEMTYRYRVRGEKGGFHRTDVLRRFPFDETEEMGSFPWRRIAREYKLRFVNDALRIYYQDDPESSLSRGRRVKRPMTGVYRNAEVLNHEIDWFWYWPKAFLLSAVHYVRFSLHCGIGPLRQFRNLENKRAVALAFLAFPIGYGVFRADLR